MVTVGIESATMDWREVLVVMEDIVPLVCNTEDVWTVVQDMLDNVTSQDTSVATTCVQTIVSAASLQVIISALDAAPTIKLKQNNVLEKNFHGGSKSTWSRGSRYSCSVCNNDYPSKSNAHRHIRIHTGIKPLECNICGLRMMEEHRRIDHLMETHTNKEVFACMGCNVCYESLAALKAHMRIEHTVRHQYVRWDCDICCKVFPNQLAKEGHGCDERYQLLEQKPITIVNKTIATVSKLHTANRINSGARQHTLRVQNSNVNEQENIRVNPIIIRPRNDKVNYCEYEGGFETNSFISLQDTDMKSCQRKRMLNRQKARCAICGENINSKQYMRHRYEEHVEREWTYHCSQCPGKLDSDLALFQHYTFHCDMRTGIGYCPVCGKRIEGGSTDLRYHIILHTGVKPYSCSRCNIENTCARFDMRKHIKMCQPNASIHFTCPLCCKECGSSRSEFNNHLTAHSEDTSEIRCRMCGVAFKWSYLLQQHLPQCKYVEGTEKDTSIQSQEGSESTGVDQGASCSGELSKTPYSRKHPRHYKKSTQHIQCLICDKHFNTSQYMSHRYEEHVESEWAYQCSECSVTLDSDLAVYQHSTAHYDSKTKCNICPICRKKVLVYHLQSHIMRYTGSNAYSCSKCKRSSRQRYNIQQHIKTFSHCKKFNARIHFTCPLCFEVFTTAEVEYYRHMSAHMKQSADIKCSGCEEVFKWSYLLQQHFQQCEKMVANDSADNGIATQWEYGSLTTTVSSKNTTADMSKSIGNQHKCDLCNVMFLSVKRLKSHYLIHHHSSSRTQCLLCGQHFSKANFLSHRYEDHVGNEWTYKCRHCSAMLDSDLALLQHCDKHCDSVTSSGQCPVCGIRMLGPLITLHTHVITTHIGVKPYSCSKCKKSYGRFQQLRNHSKKCKTNARVNFKCPLCLEAFGTDRSNFNDHLSAHLRSTTEIRCRMCAEVFKWSYLLQQHLQKCKGETSNNTKKRKTSQLEHGTLGSKRSLVDSRLDSTITESENLYASGSAHAITHGCDVNGSNEVITISESDDDSEYVSFQNNSTTNHTSPLSPIPAIATKSEEDDDILITDVLLRTPVLSAPAVESHYDTYRPITYNHDSIQQTIVQYSSDVSPATSRSIADNIADPNCIIQRRDLGQLVAHTDGNGDDEIQILQPEDFTVSRQPLSTSTSKHVATGCRDYTRIPSTSSNRSTNVANATLSVHGLPSGRQSSPTARRCRKRKTSLEVATPPARKTTHYMESLPSTEQRFVEMQRTTASSQPGLVDNDGVYHDNCALVSEEVDLTADDGDEVFPFMETLTVYKI